MSAEPNTTYVSFLLRSPTDHIDPAQRLEWLKPLLEITAPLILFVDSFYIGSLPPSTPTQKFLPLEFGELETVRQILGAQPLKLPDHRNSAKDTLEYMCIQNSKPELLTIAKPHIRTPFVAYIDSGISKIFKRSETIRMLNTLAFKDIPYLLIPGCHPPAERTVEQLELGICWIFCGGFFVMPAECIYDFAAAHRATLQGFLDRGHIAWEVNIWASNLWKFYTDTNPPLIWYAADHNDTMLSAIPAANASR